MHMSEIQKSHASQSGPVSVLRGSENQDKGIENDRAVMYFLGQERQVLSEELTSEKKPE